MKATLPFGWTGLYVAAAILTVPTGASAAPVSIPVTAAPAVGRDPLPQVQNSELEGPRPQLTRLAGDLGGAFGSSGNSPSSGLAVGAMFNLGYTMH